MFEKIYTRLLLLYPSRFRKEYKDEAQQLIQDRLHDETGFFRRARLWLDLVADLFLGLPQAYKNSYAAERTTAIVPNIEGVPSFKVLDTEPLRGGPILVAGTASLCAIVAFGFVMSHPQAYAPLSGSNKQISSIEAVLERVNKVTSPDSNIGAANEPANSSSADARIQPQSAEQTVPINASEPVTPAFSQKDNNKANAQGQAIPIQVQSTNTHFPYPKAVAASADASEQPPPAAQAVSTSTSEPIAPSFSPKNKADAQGQAIPAPALSPNANFPHPKAIAAAAGFPESTTSPASGAHANVLVHEPGKGCTASQLRLKSQDRTQLKPNSTKTTATEDCLQHHNSVAPHARHRVRPIPRQ